MKKFVLISALIGFLLDGTCQTFVFAELTGSPNLNLSGWSLNGNAYAGDTQGDTDTDPNELVLTDPFTTQSGGVFWDTPIDPSICSRWIVDFEYRIWDGNAADGIAFCFLDVPPTGFVSGGGMGVPGTANGLKVTLDTWDNCGGPNPELQILNDVGYYECAPGIVKIENTTGNLNFVRSPNYQPARIIYDNGTIEFYVNSTLYLSTFSPITFTGYMGFTASTGGFTDRHSIRNVIIYTEQAAADAGSDQFTCSGNPVQLGIAPNPNYEYNWSPATGLSDPMVSDPISTIVNNSNVPIIQQYVLTTSLSGVSSCPNTDTVLVTVYPDLDSTLIVSQCDQPYTFNGNLLNTSGIYTANLTTVNGCDSSVILDLTINSSASGVDTQTTCGPFLWIDGNTYSSSTNSPIYIIAGGASNGCDSTVTLNLTVNSPINATDIQIACESYTWIDGITYTSSTNTPTYTFASGASNGCDSTVTLDLTILNNNNSTDVQVACGSYTWIDGVTYTTSNNTATDTIYGGAINGCDSIIYLDLTINNPITFIDVQFACDSFTWTNGVTYYSNNSTAQQLFTSGASNGCDSTALLDLTVVSTQIGVDVQEACDSYTWIDGITYFNSTNTPTFVLSGGGQGGCDSIVALDLTISSAPNITLSSDTTICAGGMATLFASGANTYVWSPLIINQDDMQMAEVSPGLTTVYNVTGYNNVGCSTTVSTTVFVEEVPNASFTVSPSELDLLLNTTANFNNTSSGAVYYEWDMGDGTGLITTQNVEHTFSNLNAGSYEVTLYAENNLGCSDEYAYTVNVVEGFLVYIPNTFTPNGDNFNQSFKPFVSGGFDPFMYSLEIYNRWGELLFVSLNPDIGWDGTYNGILCPDDTYTYRLNYKLKNNDQKDFILGHLNLIK